MARANALIAAALSLATALCFVLMQPTPAAAQVSAVCNVTATGGEGEYVNGEPPQPTAGLDFDCEWTNGGASPEPPQQGTICLTLAGGGGSRTLTRDGGSETLAYAIGLQAPASPELQDGVPVAAGELAIPALEPAESAETQGQSATLAVTDLPSLPNVPAATYSDSLSWGGYIADASAGGNCDGVTGEIAGSAFTEPANISIDFTPACSIISTSAVSFASVPGGRSLTASVYGQGGISVQCTGAITYTIYLGHGQADPAGPRQMSNGAGGLLPYRLCKQSPCTGDWDDTGIELGVGAAGGVTVNGGTDPGLTTVYGEIASGTLIRRAGSYADQVQVTVAY